MDIRIETGTLTAEEYVEIKATAGWGNPPPFDLSALALEKSLIHVVARDGEKAVAMGRLLGDGVYYWHFQDIIVRPEYQGKGVGKAIMRRLTAHIETHSPPGRRVNVGLMAATGKERFYEKLGFVARPSEKYGSGMSRWLEVPASPQASTNE